MRKSRGAGGSAPRLFSNVRTTQKRSIGRACTCKLYTRTKTSLGLFVRRDGQLSKDNRVLLACSKNIGFHRSGNPMVIDRMVLSEFADIERPFKGFYQRHKSSDHKPSNCHHRQTFYDARDVV